MKVVLLEKPIGKPTQTYADKFADRPTILAYRAFCDRLRYQAYKKNQKQSLLGPTRLYVSCFVKDTTTHRREGPHTVKPDADNILKAIADALFLNDQAIYVMSCTKLWANGSQERIEIEWFTETGEL